MNIISMAACFTEGFIEASITADNLDGWQSCRDKKTSTCNAVESALNEVFDGKMMAGVKELMGMTNSLKETMTTCKTAWTGETFHFGSWVLGVVKNPQGIGYNVTTKFLVKESRDMIASNIGLMIN